MTEFIKKIEILLVNFFYYLLNKFMIFFTFIMDKLGRHRIIKDRISREKYLERYYLFFKERGNFPFNIFLHKFLKSDPDDLHDHPWAFRTFIIAGGYWEYLEDGSKHWRGPLTFRYASATTFHRIELDKNINYCWTLFIPGKKIREWGFKTKDGWINNSKYLTQKKKI
jgi:hypothetical protein